MADKPKDKSTEDHLAARAAEFAADEEARADRRARGYRRVGVIRKRPAREAGTNA